MAANCIVKKDPAASVRAAAPAVAAVHHCKSINIRNANTMKKIIRELCDLSEMEQFGKPQERPMEKNENITGVSQDFLAGDLNTINVTLRH